MSGQNIGQIVGTAIGYYFGGPFGGAIGGAIGGAAGSSFDKLPDKVGPRLTDLRPQSSEYGRPIPIVYGSIALGGNIIWAAPLFELQQVQEEGGKGGPTQATIGFSYYSYFAVAICEGERDVGRIWAGPEKRLVWDGESLVEGGDFGFGAVRVYRGTEDQLPDPLLEFYLGVGNVPAYRGTCYVVFQNFPVVNDGNRIPFLWVEVGTPGESPPPRAPEYLGDSAPPDPVYSSVLATLDGAGQIWSATPTLFGDSVEVRVNSDVTETQIASFSVPVDAGTTITSITYHPGVGLASDQIVVAGEEFGTFVDKFFVFDASASPPTYIGVTDGIYHGSVELTATLYDPNGGTLWGFRYGGKYTTNVLAAHALGDEPALGHPFVTLGTIWQPVAILAGSNRVAVGIYGSTTGVVLLDGAGLYVTRYVTVVPGAGRMFYDAVRNQVVVASSSGGLNYDIADLDTGTAFVNGTVTSRTFSASADADTSPPASTAIVSALMVNGFYVFGARATVGTGTTLYIVDPDSGTTLHTYTYEAYDADKPYLMTSPLLAPSGSTPYIFSFDQESVKRLYLRSEIAMAGQTLASVVADLSERAGLAADEIDVTQLEDDIVDGYAITQQMSVRSAIEPLRQAYYFDAVESGDVVKFVKRGGALVRQIADEDLSAHRAGDQGPDPLTTTRAMEDEMPQRVNVSHLLAATKYATATKDAQRQIGASEQRITLDLPIVMTDTKGQEVAEVNLHAAWAQRLAHTFALGRKHADLEPTDIVMVKGQTMRITNIKDTPDGVREVSAVHDASHFYQPHVIVTETPPVTDEVYVPDETVLEIM